jgi:hypothetical protein
MGKEDAVGTREHIEDLQATSGQVIADADRIVALEQEKRTVDPGSTRFRQLSDEIERVADSVRIVSSAESDLADEVAGKDGLPTIAEADESTDGEGPSSRR